MNVLEVFEGEDRLVDKQVQDYKLGEDDLGAGPKVDMEEEE